MAHHPIPTQVADARDGDAAAHVVARLLARKPRLEAPLLRFNATAVQTAGVHFKHWSDIDKLVRYEHFEIDEEEYQRGKS